MHLFKSLAAGTAVLASLAVADFEILAVAGGDHTVSFCNAVGHSTLDCNHITHFGNGASAIFSQDCLETPATMDLSSGMCGAGQLEFVHQSDGTYLAYDEGHVGGDVLATCYTTSGSGQCGSQTFYQLYYCYSYLCE